ncbi:MAG: hypothetical protein IT436_14495 [Phycisphaerales bacterium]|nr:hypothetical protein [Phycisphaerales bacterium]
MTDPAPLPPAPVVSASASGVLGPGPSAPLSIPRRLITFTLGLLMLAAALWAVLRAEGLTARAWESMRGAPWWLIAAAIALPIANWLLVSWSFAVLTRRYGRVGGGEMACLIGAAWLLNYLPVRPGLIGRLAYHKKVNSIALTDSARVLALAILLTGAALLTILAASAAQARLGLTWPMAAAMVAGAGLIIGGLLARAGEDGWRFAIAYLARLLDCIAWVLRYLVVYALVGQPVTVGQAAAIAAVSQIVLLIPIIGNGLGLRELAVGFVGASLPAWYSAGGDALARTDGWAADIVNRAVELLVAIPVGMVCAGLVARRLARAPQGPSTMSPGGTSGSIPGAGSGGPAQPALPSPITETPGVPS